MPQVTAALGWPDASPLPHSKKSGEAIAAASPACATAARSRPKPFEQLRIPPRRARVDDGRHGPRPHGARPRPRRLRGREAARLQGGRPVSLPGRRGRLLRRERAGVPPREESRDPEDARPERERRRSRGPRHEPRGGGIVRQPSRPGSLRFSPPFEEVSLPLLSPLLALQEPRHLPGDAPVVHRPRRAPRRAIGEIRGRVKWIPSYSENRIGAMVENRLEWAISRQRRWGSPITFLRCADCREKGVVSHYPAVEGDVGEKEKKEREDFFERVRETFREHGADAWYDDAFPPSYFLSKSSSSPLLPLPLRPPARAAAARTSRRSRTSSTSGSTRACRTRPCSARATTASRTRTRRSRPTPVMYLEGHDQHRGWFQSSLLTSVALTGRAPYDAVLTHGFVVAGDGRKMSKSLGNTVEPHDLLKTDGADVHPPLGRLARLHERRPGLEGNPQANGRGVSQDPQHGALPALESVRLRSGEGQRAGKPPRAPRPVGARRRGAVRRRSAGSVRRLCVSRRVAAPPRPRDDGPVGLLVRRSQGRPLRPRRERSGAALRPDGRLPARRDDRRRALADLPVHGGGDLGGDPRERGGPVGALPEKLDDLELPEISSNERKAWGRILALRAEFLARLEPLRRDGKVGSAAQAVVEIGPSQPFDATSLSLPFQKKNSPRCLACRSSCARWERQGPSKAISTAVSPCPSAPPRARSARAAGRCARTSSPAAICARCRRVVGE